MVIETKRPPHPDLTPKTGLRRGLVACNAAISACEKCGRLERMGRRWFSFLFLLGRLSGTVFLVFGFWGGERGQGHGDAFLSLRTSGRFSCFLGFLMALKGGHFVAGFEALEAIARVVGLQPGAIPPPPYRCWILREWFFSTAMDDQRDIHTCTSGNTHIVI